MNVKKLSLTSLLLMMVCGFGWAQTHTFVKVTKLSQLVPDNNYIIVCEDPYGDDTGYAALYVGEKSKSPVKVIHSKVGSKDMYLVESEINGVGNPLALKLGKQGEGYTFQSTSSADNGQYLNMSHNGKISMSSTPSTWTIKVSEKEFIYSEETGLFAVGVGENNIILKGSGNNGFHQFKGDYGDHPVAIYVETTGGDIGQTEITFGRSSEGGDYYATVYYGNNDFIMDNDMTAWGLSSSLTSVIPAGETSTIELKDLKPENEVIYAGTPVILKINSELVESTSEFIEYPIHLLVEAHQNLATDTYLKGTDVEITSAPENTYKMTRKSGVLGFYKADGTTINAHRAYIEVPASTVKQFTFSLNGETAIKEISTPQEQEINNDDTTYNLLTGQKVNKNHKGLVVKKGKKFINK